jgi:hypothetical protein
MAFTLSTRAGNTGTDVIQDISATATKQGVYSSAKTLWAVYIDNTANASTTVYLKLWNVASGSVTVGTTEPSMVIPCAGGQKRQITVDQGIAFSTALVYACVTGAATSSTASPASAVQISILAS